MDAPLTAPDALIRPWRTATIAASLVAAVELVLLVGAAILLLAKPLSHAVRNAALSSPASHARVKPVKGTAAVSKHLPVVKPKLSRAHTGIFVLNGNGRSGAAAAAADNLHRLGYQVRGTGNATRQDYATTVVMYRKGFRPEGIRLARDLHVTVVGPLDGLRSSALHGGQVAVILGVG